MGVITLGIIKDKLGILARKLGNVKTTTSLEAAEINKGYMKERLNLAQDKGRIKARQEHQLQRATPQQKTKGSFTDSGFSFKKMIEYEPPPINLGTSKKKEEPMSLFTKGGV